MYLTKSECKERGYDWVSMSEMPVGTLRPLSVERLAKIRMKKYPWQIRRYFVPTKVAKKIERYDKMSREEQKAWRVERNNYRKELLSMKSTKSSVSSTKGTE